MERNILIPDTDLKVSPWAWAPWTPACAGARTRLTRT